METLNDKSNNNNDPFNFSQLENLERQGDNEREEPIGDDGVIMRYDRTSFVSSGRGLIPTATFYDKDGNRGYSNFDTREEAEKYINEHSDTEMVIGPAMPWFDGEHLYPETRNERVGVYIKKKKSEESEKSEKSEAPKAVTKDGKTFHHFPDFPDFPDGSVMV